MEVDAETLAFSFVTCERAFASGDSESVYREKSIWMGCVD